MAVALNLLRHFDDDLAIEFSEHSSSNWEAHLLFHRERICTMECRDVLLKLTFGLVASPAMFGTAAQAAPISPMNAASAPIHATAAQPALVSQDEVNQIKPEQVRWHHHGGWHHRHWHHRGWHHRHWHRHYWHPRHWRHHHRHW